MERQAYWTDLTDEEWAIIERLLPKRTEQRGAPRTIDRRNIINGIFYVNRTGCPWRYLPLNFPNWSTVYGVFWQWRNDGTWMKINDGLRKLTRKSEGREVSPSAAIIDSQSAKTTEVGGPHGYDAGKKVNGRKRHIGVDAMGLLLAVFVGSASEQDYDGAKSLLQRLKEHVTRRLKVIFADSAYGKCGLPDWTKKTFGWILQTVLRPVATSGFVVLPKRWIVERTFAWIGRNRRHAKDYERTTQSSEAMIYISMIHLMLRRMTHA